MSIVVWLFSLGHNSYELPSRAECPQRVKAQIVMSVSLGNLVWVGYILIQHFHSLESLPRASAQEQTNRTLAVHERENSRFLVLPGSLSIFTQITGHKYFSPLKPCREIKYESE